jgi:hypothetical protein
VTPHIPKRLITLLTNLTVKLINLLAMYQCLALVSSNQHTKTIQPGADWENPTRISDIAPITKKT